MMPMLSSPLTVVVVLTHRGRATHICFSKLIIIASDNGLSPGQCQAIIWNNAGILSVELLGTKFSEILIEILIFSSKKMRLKVLSAKWLPFCLGRNVLICISSYHLINNPTRNCFLTHWCRVTQICVGKLTIIGSDNDLSPDRRQAIIWTNAGLLLIGPLGTNFSEILIEILAFSFKKMRLKVSSAKRRPFCLGLNVLT